MPSMDGKLEELVKKLQEAAGANLVSVILYGSAARGDYRETYSDLNVLCTMGSLGAEELRRVAPVGKVVVHREKGTGAAVFLA